MTNRDNDAHFDGELRQLMDELIVEADRRKAERLRQQGQRDRLWRLRMRSMANSTMMIGALADLLARKLGPNDDLRTAALWIGEQAEHIEAALLAMAQEGAEDE